MSRAGEFFPIAAENPAVHGCTVSGRETGEICRFAPTAEKDISAEVYPYPKLIVMAEGVMEVCAAYGRSWTTPAKDCLITPADIPVGMRPEPGAVYTDICLRRIKT